MMSRPWMTIFPLFLAMTIESNEAETSNTYSSYYDTKLQEFVLKVNSSGDDLDVYDALNIHQNGSNPIGAIFLNGTRLKRLPFERLFHYTSLSRLHLNNNNITTLHGDTFKWSTQLWLLYLQNNNLKQLTRNIFSELRLLHFLCLSNNNIKSLEEDIFQNLSSLWALYLDRNNLESLPEKIFTNLTSLSFLYLDENRISFLNESLFGGLSSLRYLSLRGNSLTSLPDNIFKNLTSLLYLDLSNNKFTKLDDKWFLTLHSLKSLYITNNSIEKLNPGVFSNMAKLAIIKLDDNRILELREDIFLGLSALQTFSMKRNALLSFDLTLLEKQMDVVDLEDNNIHQVFCSNEFFAENIGTLSLSGNKLTKLPACYIRFGHIAVLDLSRNKLNLSGIADFSPLVYMQEENKRNYRQIIDLRQNLVTSLELNSSQMSSNIKWMLRQVGLQMRGNNITCDCHAYRLYTFLVEAFKNNPSELTRGFLRSWVCSDSKKHLIEMKASDLRCVRSNLMGCPSECQCARSSHDLSVSVNCHGKGLKVLPLILPQNTTILDVHNNSIEELSHRNYLRHLSVLNINNNSVSKIDKYAVINLVTLKELHIARNAIKALPNSFDKLYATKFSLSQNPFHCDCHGISTRDWIVKNYGAILDIELLTCPGGRYLDSDFVCRLKPFEIVLIILSISAIWALIVYKYRREIKVIIFTRFKLHPFDRDKENDIRYKLYDAFVAYSKEDAGWVGHTLVPKIETPTSPYHLCIEDRDYLAGECITKNILYSIKYSRRMILCLTNSILKNKWGMYQFLMAHDQVLQGSSRYLIIILFDHIKYDDLNVELKAYLRTHTYIEYNDKRFWQKLAYALPVNPLLRLRGLEFPPDGFGCLVPRASSLIGIPNTGLSYEEIQSRIRIEQADRG